MTIARPAHLLLAATCALALAACSSEEPPDWLADLAAEAQTTTTAAGVSTIPPATAVDDGRGDRTAALALDKGTCVIDAPFTRGEPVEVASVTSVDCAEPHQAEVYDVVQLPQQQGEPFPGDRLERQARNQCLRRFETFVGLPWTASQLEFVSLRPTEDSWGQGDRAIVCVVFRPDGKDLTGTVMDAAY